jgi:hypothetical protein
MAEACIRRPYNGNPPLRFPEASGYSPNIKPRWDRRVQRGLLRSASAGAELCDKLEVHQFVPENLCTLKIARFFSHSSRS